MKRIAVITLALLMFTVLMLTATNASAQSQEVHNYLRKLAQGKSDEVKKALPDLLIDYPDDPGVILLHAAVIVDGAKALERYKKIVTQYSNSEWADDAYWRIVQYYAITGDTTSAKKELEAYRAKYPKSEFLIAATEALKASIAFAKSKSASAIDSPKKESVKKEPAKKDNPTKTSDTKENKKNKIQKKADKDAKQAQPKTESKSNAKTEAPKDEEKAPKADATKYGLQIGVYGTEETARNQVEQYRKQRLIANIYPKKVGDAEMYAVVIGDYSGKESAEKARELVQSQCKCVPLLFVK